jgi:4-hydroxybenzoate polyprenyltransferase
MKKITLSLKLIRPQQWVKNSFIFLPIFFSGKANQIMLLYDCFLAFVIFCLFASSIYVFNDIIDADFGYFRKFKD